MKIKDIFGIEYSIYTSLDAWGAKTLFSTHVENGLSITRSYSSEFSIELEFGDPFRFESGTLDSVVGFYRENDF